MRKSQNENEILNAPEEFPVRSSVGILEEVHERNSEPFERTSGGILERTVYGETGCIH